MPRAVAVGIGLTILSAFSFGSGALFAKPVYALDVGWHVLMAWRFLVGAALGWAWLLLRPNTRASLRRMRRRDVAVAIALGVLYTGNSATYFAGLETVSASLSALIVYIYPALVAVISLQVGQPLQGRRAWGALALALVGVALAVGNIDTAAAPPLSGLILIAASPVIYSIWIVLSARLSGEARSGVGAESGAGADPLSAGVVMLSATAVTYWLSALVLGQPVLPAQIPDGAWFGLIGIGIVSTFIAVLAFYGGAHLIGAARASLVSTVEPIWTITLASLLFGESLGPIQLLGGALILGGVILSQTGDRAPHGPVSELRIADE
ncbi:MAG TPA: DMT family transporter [Candidatus Limnocylindria bacterium]|nr:DMT family transporter [Candidatus Limnocylindria bacterium]